MTSGTSEPQTNVNTSNIQDIIINDIISHKQNHQVSSSESKQNSIFLRLYQKNTSLLSKIVEFNEYIKQQQQQQLGREPTAIYVPDQPVNEEFNNGTIPSFGEHPHDPTFSNEGHPWPVGGTNMDFENFSSPPTQQFRDATPTSGPSAWGTSNSIREQPQSGTINESSVLLGTGNNSETSGAHSSNARPSGNILPRRRVNNPYQSGPPRIPTANLPHDQRSNEEQQQQLGGGNLVVLENSEPMGRHNPSHRPIVSEARATTTVSGHSMGSNKDEQEAGVPSRFMDSRRRRGSQSGLDLGVNSTRHPQSEERSTANNSNNRTVTKVHESKSSNSVADRPQHQTRRDRDSRRRSTGAAAARSSSDLPSRETQGRTALISTSDATILRGQSEVGADSGHTALHTSPLGDSDILHPIEVNEVKMKMARNNNINIKEEMEAFIESINEQMTPTIGTSGKSPATITKKKRKTVVASTQQVLSLPCANIKSGVVNEKKLVALLNNEGLKQWNDGKAAAFSPDKICDIEADTKITTTNCYPPEVFKQLINEEFFETVSEQHKQQQPTKSSGSIIFTVEHRVSGTTITARTRMLFWAKRQNEHLKNSSSSYKCVTHMKALGAYLSGIENEAVAVGDIKSGFQHIQIPVTARAWFRFVDSDGNLYQMTRLPMGLVPSVQLMEVITLALIGSPIVCNSASVFHGIKSDGYVDDFRIIGSSRRVENTVTNIKKRAADMNVTIKDLDNFQATTTVTFLGVEWDHKKKEVRVCDKTLSKLPQQFGSTIAAGDLHRTVGRLIFCSSPLSINLGRFYFTMKHTTRVCNKINNGLIDEETTISLTPALKNSLQKWRDEVHNTKSYVGTDWHRHNNSPRCTLFTDASMFGWGAYLIAHDGSVHIVGGAWNDSSIVSGDISWLEARAVRYAIQALRGIIMQHRAVDLRIDNTSVQTAMERGRARATTVHVEVIQPIEWLRIHNIHVYVAYVESAKNLADPISRGIYPQ